MLVERYALIAILSLIANSLLAQGTIAQFTWHGDSNFFQVGFEVPISDLQPGVSFSDMFMQTLAVTNPLGQTYHGGDSTSAGSGTYIPWDISVQMNDFQGSTEVVISGGGLAGSTHRTGGVVWEQQMSGPFLYFETGYWSFAQIPEPSAIGLFLFAVGLAFFARKRTSKE